MADIKNVQNRFFLFRFGFLVRFLKINSDLVWDEFCSVWFEKTRFGYYSYLLLMYSDSRVVNVQQILQHYCFDTLAYLINFNNHISVIYMLSFVLVVF